MELEERPVPLPYNTVYEGADVFSLAFAWKIKIHYTVIRTCMNNILHFRERGERVSDLFEIMMHKRNVHNEVTAGLLFQVICWAVGNDFSLVDDHHPVTCCLSLGEYMSWENNCLFFAYLLDNVPDFDNLVRVKTGCRFVQYQDLRVVHHCLGETDTLFVALW